MTTLFTQNYVCREYTLHILQSFEPSTREGCAHNVSVHTRTFTWECMQETLGAAVRVLFISYQ